MNNENMIDLENEDFWKRTMKKSVAKRLIKRGYTNPEMIEDICNLKKDESERLVKLDSTFIRRYDQSKREEYLVYYRSHKYEDWECKRVIDLNEIDIYEICEGKGQPFILDFENILEARLFENGEKIAKNLALIKMTDLNYPEADITRILGDTKTENIYQRNVFIKDEVVNKMENHFINMGIESKRMEILINLLEFEDNLKNASSITGMTIEDIEKIIDDHELFKSEDSILDPEKIKKEKELTNIEILLEAIVIDDIKDYEIEDYAKLSGLDETEMTRLYQLNCKFRPGLYEYLRQCSRRLIERNFDYEEIEEISGINIFYIVGDAYYYEKYKIGLSDELFEEIR